MLPKILWSKKYSTAVCRTTEGDSLEVNGSSSQEIEEQAAALEEELNEMEQQAAELGQESLFQDTEQESLEQWQLEMAQHEREHGAGWRSMIGELSSSWNPELGQAATAYRQTALAASSESADPELIQAKTAFRQELLVAGVQIGGKLLTEFTLTESLKKVMLWNLETPSSLPRKGFQS